MKVKCETWAAELNAKIGTKLDTKVTAKLKDKIAVELDDKITAELNGKTGSKSVAKRGFFKRIRHSEVVIKIRENHENGCFFKMQEKYTPDFLEGIATKICRKTS